MDLHSALKKFGVTGLGMLFPDFQHCKGGIVASGWLRASHRVKVGAIPTEIRPWQNHE